MVKKIIQWIAGICLLTSMAHAGPGLLFTIVESDNPNKIDMVLCLNGIAPLSCQNYRVAAGNLQITTRMNHNYPSAGIKILTPGYTPTGCKPMANGYCIFSASQTSSIDIFVKGGSYTVTPENNGHVIVSPSTPQTIDAGQTTSFSVLAEPDYDVSHTVTGNCPQGTWNGNTYTTGAIIDDCSVGFEGMLKTTNISLNNPNLLLMPTTSGSIKVTNNGLETAKDIMATLSPELARHVTQDASNCVLLPPGTSCNLNFSSKQQPYPATPIVISGSNTNSLNASIKLAYSYVTNREVNAILIDEPNNRTYIAGGFQLVGPNTGSGVPLDINSGLSTGAYPRVNGIVNTVVSDNHGGWFIGGTFNMVGVENRRNLAHILADGSVDPVWNPNPDNTIYALLLNGNQLYTGGSFTTIGGEARNNLAALDAETGLPTSWSTIGANQIVRAFALNGNTLYIGGYFTSINGQLQKYVAALNTTTGAVAPWTTDINNGIRTVALNDNTLYIGGEFITINGATRNRIAALDATTGALTSWNPNAQGSGIFSIVTDGIRVYVGGLFTAIGANVQLPRTNLAALDISSGEAISNWIANTNLSLHHLNIANNKLYVCGGYTSIVGVGGLPGVSRDGLARLDPATGVPDNWDPVANHSVYSLAFDGNTVYAAGEFTSINSVRRPYIAALNLETGIPLNWNPNANRAVYALAKMGNTVYAGGFFTSIGQENRNYLAAIDATTAIATSWNPSPSSRVMALATSGNTIYAGGFFTNVGGTPRNYIAAFDADTGLTSWDPNASNRVLTLKISSDKVYAGGMFTAIGANAQPSRNYIAALEMDTGDATDWDPNANGTVNTIDIDEDTVYVGGAFTAIGANAQPSRIRIAALQISSGNATSWNPIANQEVKVVAAKDDKVYVGGDFSSIGGQGRNRLAALYKDTGNVSPWNPNPNFSVFAIAFHGNNLYIGGDFNIFSTLRVPYYNVLPLDTSN